MITHIVVGDEAARPLQEAISLEPSMAGELLVLRDILNVGPLQKEAGSSFSELRSAFWQDVTLKPELRTDDMERLLALSAAMHQQPEHEAWVWMAPLPADVCAYHWTVKYLSKYPGRFKLLHIAGLPFLNEQGKVFFPKSLSEILPRELVKARRLARPVTTSEAELDADSWEQLVAADSGIRTLEGGKKLISRPEDFYDALLLEACTAQFQKASRVIHQAMHKQHIPTGDLYLGWRLRRMAASGLLELQGEPGRGLKEFDVKQS